MDGILSGARAEGIGPAEAEAAAAGQPEGEGILGMVAAAGSLSSPMGVRPNSPPNHQGRPRPQGPRSARRGQLKAGRFRGNGPRCHRSGGPETRQFARRGEPSPHTGVPPPHTYGVRVCPVHRSLPVFCGRFVCRIPQRVVAFGLLEEATRHGYHPSGGTHTMNSDKLNPTDTPMEQTIPGQRFGLWLLAGTMFFLAILILGDLLAVVFR